MDGQCHRVSLLLSISCSLLHGAVSTAREFKELLTSSLQVHLKPDKVPFSLLLLRCSSLLDCVRICISFRCIRNWHFGFLYFFTAAAFSRARHSFCVSRVGQTSSGFKTVKVNINKIRAFLCAFIKRRCRRLGHNNGGGVGEEFVVGFGLQSSFSVRSLANKL